MTPDAAARAKIMDEFNVLHGCRDDIGIDCRSCTMNTDRMLLRIAACVAEAVRGENEACARVAAWYEPGAGYSFDTGQMWRAQASKAIAVLIRARQRADGG